MGRPLSTLSARDQPAPGNGGAGGAVAATVGPATLGGRLVHAVRGASREVALISDARRPTQFSPWVVATREASTRGVLVRAVYDRGALAAGGQHPLLEHGARVVRVIDRAPCGLMIVDGRLGFVAAGPAGDGAIAVGRSPLLDALTELFEMVWEAALPVPTAGAQRATAGPADPDDRRILSLLAAGLTDAAIGAQVGLSARTVRRRVSGLMRELRARSRFEAGVKAKDRGWL